MTLPELTAEQKQKYVKWQGLGNVDSPEKQLARTKPWMRLGRCEWKFFNLSPTEYICSGTFSAGEHRLGAGCFSQITRIGSKL